MRKGFTLIELLLVIAAIAILVGIIVVGVNGTDTTPQTEQQQCKWYENMAQKDLPAKCLKYYK